MYVIAIDGPAGAGKSTLAKALAAKLGWANLDTGSFYRAVAHLALQGHVALDCQEVLVRLAEDSPFVYDTGAVTHVGETDIRQDIRTPAVTAATSTISTLPEVRRVVTRRIQEFAEQRDVIAEGRDMAQVFPHATLKVYLTASPRQRAERRQAEAGGDLDDIEAAIAARDHQDSNRTHSPLKPTVDSWVIDTTGLSVDEVVDCITALLSTAR